MPHFAARAGFFFAVEVQAGGRIGDVGLALFQILPQNVEHDGLAVRDRAAQRQASDTTHEHFELAARTGINRPVS